MAALRFSRAAFPTFTTPPMMHWNVLIACRAMFMATWRMRCRLQTVTRWNDNESPSKHGCTPIQSRCFSNIHHPSYDALECFNRLPRDVYGNLENAL